MRPWPNAPRACLLASTWRSEVTCEDEVGEVLLRVVDDGEPLVELGEVRHRALGLLLHRLAEAMRHRIEPLGDRARQLRLTAGQHLAHGVHAAGRLGLHAHDLGHALFELSGVDVVARRLDPAHARRARQHDGDRGKQREHHAGEAGQRFAGRNADPADGEEGLGHDRLVARFALTRTKREHKFDRAMQLRRGFAADRPPKGRHSAVRLTAAWSAA